MMLKMCYLRRSFTKVSFLHSPSNIKVKGTEIINNAIYKLKKDYDFNYNLIFDVPHQKVQDEIQKNNILIDQLFCGWYVELLSRQ